MVCGPLCVLGRASWCVEWVCPGGGRAEPPAYPTRGPCETQTARLPGGGVAEGVPGPGSPQALAEKGPPGCFGVGWGPIFPESCVSCSCSILLRKRDIFLLEIEAQRWAFEGAQVRKPGLALGLRPDGPSLAPLRDKRVTVKSKRLELRKHIVTFC